MGEFWKPVHDRFPLHGESSPMTQGWFIAALSSKSNIRTTVMRRRRQLIRAGWCYRIPIIRILPILLCITRRINAMTQGPKTFRASSINNTSQLNPPHHNCDQNRQRISQYSSIESMRKPQGNCFATPYILDVYINDRSLTKTVDQIKYETECASYFCLESNVS